MKAQTKFPWLIIISLLSVGLAFVGAPSVAVGMLLLSPSLKYGSQALAISAMQAPGFTKAMWPAGTDDSKFVQIGDLDKELANATQEMADRINTGVQLLMTDMPTFVAFAESGRFSGSETLSLPAKTDGLDYALTTYMLSEAMAKNGWYIVPHLGPYNSAAEVANGPFGCTMGPNNVCTVDDQASFWSESSRRVYTLTNAEHNDNKKTPLQLTQDIISNGWAALNVLFDGAFNCTAEGKAGSAAVNFNWDGTLDIACVSQLSVYIACGAPCPAPLINGKCPFGWVPMSQCKL